jgi:DNA-binding beta-propeller fold protein YncE
MGGEVKNMRRLLLAASLLVLVAGCGSPGPAAAGNYKLYEATSAGTGQTVAVIDTHTKATELRLPWGAPSPDGKHFYALGANTLQDIDPRSGAVLRTLQVPGTFQMPPATLGGVPGGLSQNGRYLVLEVPGLRTASNLLLIDTQLFKVEKRIDLNGKFEFDAVNNTGQSIYLIQYPNPADSYYHVRVYEVLAGRLGDYTVVDKGGPGEIMTGVRLSGIFSPDGQWLYSLYARANQGAFVHALNLTSPYAFCLDLPGSGYASNSNAFQWSLAMTPDGRHVYAANGPLGLVTQIDNLDGGAPSIVHSANFPSIAKTASVFVKAVAAKEMGLGPHGAVVSNDGRMLVTAGMNGLIVIDTNGLKVRDRLLTNWSVSSLAASPDGATFYAVSEGGTIAEISMARAAVTATFDPAAGSPMGLLRVEPA